MHKWKSLLLYTLGFGLLLLSNTTLWHNYRKEQEEAREQQQIDERNSKVTSGFESQQVVFDSTAQKWVNRSFSFGIMHVSADDLKSGNIKRTITIESNANVETASGSK